MSVEIEFPLEFLVPGTPVSLQAKRRGSIETWKERIRRAGTDVLPEAHFSTAVPIAVTLYYFPATQMAGDIDNIVKPILDALCGFVYVDDRQVERIWVQKFEPGRILLPSPQSPRLEAAVCHPRPVLYVRLSDDLSEGLK
jgi:crossover junction endodeoxyribonuclease RusA